MSDRLWSDDDRELVAEILDDRLESIGDSYDVTAEAVLDALTAAGWARTEGCSHDTTGRHGPGWCIQPDFAALREPAAPDESGAIMARLESEWRARGWAPRAEVAEEIAQAIEEADRHVDVTVAEMAATARAHRTTPEAADG